MSSPKYLRTCKSPKNNSGKNQDLKPVQKKCEKSKQPMDKQRRLRQQLKNKIQQMSHQCKHLETELTKERMKSNMLEKQVKSLLEELRYYKEEERGGQERIAGPEKLKIESNGEFPSGSGQGTQKLSTQKKQQNYQSSQETISAFQPSSPTQKMQVGGYFGSLFN